MKPRLTIVAPERTKDWVLGKMADRLAEQTTELGWNAAIAEAPDSASDINHWIYYMDSWQYFRDGGPRPAAGTFWITHLDDAYKRRMARELCSDGYFGLCMSHQTRADLIREGAPEHRLGVVGAACDPKDPLPLIRVGLATRLYPDGRKNEWMLSSLAKDCDLSQFEFRIWGNGWTEEVAKLRGLGMRIYYANEHGEEATSYASLRAGLAACDYYLYPGWDEGSLGTVDALTSNVKAIVTAQGFHLDYPGHIEHLFSKYEELREIFREIARRRTGRNALTAHFSWRSYAERHVQRWTELLRQGRINEGKIPAAAQTPSMPRLKLWSRVLSTKTFVRYYRLDRLLARMRGRAR